MFWKVFSSAVRIYRVYMYASIVVGIQIKIVSTAATRWPRKKVSTSVTQKSNYIYYTKKKTSLRVFFVCKKTFSRIEILWRPFIFQRSALYSGTRIYLYAALSRYFFNR